MLFHKIKEKLIDPYKLLEFILRKLSPFITNDELYVRIRYFLCMHKILHLSPPRTFNEKLQWLKLYNRKPEYSDLVDKFRVKELVKDVVGEDHIIPTIGVWERFDDIDFQNLPSKFVLKCTHDSGGVVICKDKDSFDYEKARRIINKSMQRNYYQITREFPYKNVKPRIIAEHYMVDESGVELKDYKFYCFDGKPEACFVISGRPDHTCCDFFDMDFNKLPIQQGYPNADFKMSKPAGFDTMIAFASKLSKGFPHLRVDFYDISGKVYFGELTFFDGGGHCRFNPDCWDRYFGDMISLPSQKITQ